MNASLRGCLARRAGVPDHREGVVVTRRAGATRRGGCTGRALPERGSARLTASGTPDRSFVAEFPIRLLTTPCQAGTAALSFNEFPIQDTFR
jgi:hypothetical protein